MQLLAQLQRMESRGYVYSQTVSELSRYMYKERLDSVELVVTISNQRPMCVFLLQRTCHSSWRLPVTSVLCARHSGSASLSCHWGRATPAMSLRLHDSVNKEPVKCRESDLRDG